MGIDMIGVLRQTNTINDTVGGVRMGVAENQASCVNTVLSGYNMKETIADLLTLEVLISLELRKSRKRVNSTQPLCRSCRP